MDLAHAISIVVARPLVVAVIDRGVWQIHSLVTAVLIRIHHRRVVWDRLSENALTGDLVAVPDQWAAFFARLAADDVDDRRPVRTAAAQDPRSHFLTFNLTPMFLPKLRNGYFVMLFVTMSGRFRATICAVRSWITRGH
jgi:hypothetical protein